MKKVRESPEVHYREALKQDRFEIQKCDGCTQYCFPPRIVCPNCGGADLQWEAPSGMGVVYSSTVVSRRDEQGGPYNVVLVNLDEGLRPTCIRSSLRSRK